MYFVKCIIKLEGVLYMIDCSVKKNIYYVEYFTYAEKHRRSLFTAAYRRRRVGVNQLYSSIERSLKVSDLGR